MPLTLDEITQHEKRARREIAERECLLAALKIRRGYTAPDDTSTPTGTDLLLVGFIPSTTQIGWKELSAPSPVAAPTPSAPPPKPPTEVPPPRCVHPELAALGNRHGNRRQGCEVGD